MSKPLFPAIIAALTLGCQVPRERMRSSSTPNPAPEITSETEEGFHDLVFSLASATRATDGSQEVTAVGTHAGQPVCFQATLSPTWKEGRVADRRSFTGVVTVRSLGVESDALVKAMDTLYEAQLKPTSMAKATQFAAITLNGNPSDLTAGEVAIKLFFESENEDRYAELYLNIDVPKHRVELREKDEGYRAPVIRALSLGPELNGRGHR